jgi:hypothetical protein
MLGFCLVGLPLFLLTSEILKMFLKDLEKLYICYIHIPLNFVDSEHKKIQKRLNILLVI